jgi:hypothetical protein
LISSFSVPAHWEVRLSHDVRRLRGRLRLQAAAWLALWVSTAPGARGFAQGEREARVIALSPGDAEYAVGIATRCPTFSWTHVAGAVGYELRVFAAGWAREGEPVDAVDLVGTAPLWTARLPAGSVAWTAGGGRCFEEAGAYAWQVRVLEGAQLDGDGQASEGASGPADAGASVDWLDQDDHARGWSALRWFAAPPAPTDEEVERALEVLARYRSRSDVEDSPSGRESAAGRRPGAGVDHGAAPAGVTRASSAALVLPPAGSTGLRVEKFGVNTSTAVLAGVESGIGVFGIQGEFLSLINGTGVAGNGASYGVTGFTLDGEGVFGSSQNGEGVRGQGPFGVVGKSGAEGLPQAYVGTAGVWGDASGVAGVFGTSGTNVGVAGATNSTSSYGGHFRNAVGGTALYVDGNGGGVGTKPTIVAANGATLTNGGAWTNSSDAALKTDFEQLDEAELLERLERLPIRSWRYLSEPDGPRHVGPTAQDFEAAFGLGGDGKSISTVDPAGIALAVAQELARRLEQRERDHLRQLQERDRELSALRRRLTRLERSR